jgi:hypothetical protein
MGLAEEQLCAEGVLSEIDRFQAEGVPCTPFADMLQQRLGFVQDGHSAIGEWRIPECL